MYEFPNANTTEYIDQIFKELELIKLIIKAKNYEYLQFISCDIHYGIAKYGKDQGVVTQGKQPL
ncbi:27_t:CDS:2, partial [Rhizophagus irregularis]